MPDRSSEAYDLVVVGGGMGGLATAALAQRQGLRTALLESHTKLGGCAGYFERGPYTFDAGATALMGLGLGEPVGDLLESIGLNFETVVTPSYRLHLPDRRLDIVADDHAFESAVLAAFPGLGAAQARFWRLQAAVGNILFRAAARVPRFPIRSAADLVHDLRVLGPRGVPASLTAGLTTQTVLRLLGLDRDRAFTTMIAMLLQDTAQAGPEVVPFAQAAACLQAYRLGMSRPKGGMRALAEGLGERFVRLGGDLRTAALVDRIEPTDSGFLVNTRRRHRLHARQVALNLPLDLAAKLLGHTLEGRLGRQERRSRARWSAVTGYLAIRRDAVPDDSPLFHQVVQDYDRPLHDGNNTLVSLSPPDDPGYGPPDVRVATLSTHTRPSDWANLHGHAYSERKADLSARLLSALDRALPGASESLVHAEFATPRSFARYTRRTLGAVGGPPVSRRNSAPFAVDPAALGPGTWLVGDSVFPGQGTMATVLSAIRVVERITGRSWGEMKADAAPSQRSSAEPAAPARRAFATNNTL